jgi:hypothetical protein
MRILYDHQIFCLQQYGGILRYFYELANHFSGTARFDCYSLSIRNTQF